MLGHEQSLTHVKVMSYLNQSDIFFLAATNQNPCFGPGSRWDRTAWGFRPTKVWLLANPSSIRHVSQEEAYFSRMRKITIGILRHILGQIFRIPKPRWLSSSRWHTCHQTSFWKKYFDLENIFINSVKFGTFPVDLDKSEYYNSRIVNVLQDTVLGFSVKKGWVIFYKKILWPKIFDTWVQWKL